MAKIILLGLVLVLVLSCNKDDGDDSVKQGIGKVWISGGLAYCAEQIHLDNGVVLVVDIEDLMSLKSGDRVSLKYKEIGLSATCAPWIDSKIIEIKKVQ